MGHGDDLYETNLSVTPADKLMTSYSWWKDNVEIYTKNSRDPQLIKNSQYPSAQLVTLYTPQSIYRNYCTGGKRAYLERLYGSILSVSEINAFESKILNRTNNCL